MGDIKKFEADMEAMGEKLGIMPSMIARAVAIQCLRGFMERSPVDTGRFRGNWMIGIDSMNPDTMGEGDKFPGRKPHSGEVYANPIGARINDIRATPNGAVIWITNSLPYAKPLNMGHSTQAPAHFVEIETAKVEAGLESEYMARL
jgi:hypothetical protein